MTAPRVGAQRPPGLREPYVRPAVYGRIFDSTTGAPVGRVGVAVVGRVGTAFSDSLGRYLLFGLPTGEREVRFTCPSQRRFGRAFTSRSVAVTPRTDSAVDFRLSFAGCAEPAVDSGRVEMAGHYRAGFEASDFAPCRSLPDLAGTAYAGQARRVWVTFAPGVHALPGGWPPPTSDGYWRLYVRWRGVLTGPGSYGHMGVALYELRVDDVLEVRAPGEADCR